MPAWEAVAGITNAIAGALEPAFNAGATIWNNERNIKFQEKENEITRQREDTAHQREVADLEAAGLSPLASVNGAQAQELTAPQAEAPQMDTSALRDTMAILMQNERKKEELEESKRQHNENLTMQQEMLEESKRQFNETQELTKQIENAKIANKIQEFLITEQRLNNEIEYNAEANTRKTRVELSQQSIETYKALCKQWEYTFKQENFVDYTQYLNSKQSFDTQMQKFTEWLSKKGVSEPNTSERNYNLKSKNSGAGTSIGAGYAGAGITTSVNSSSGKTNANAEEFNRTGTWTKQVEMGKLIEQYCKETSTNKNYFLVYPTYMPREEELNKGRKHYKTTDKWNYIK